MYQGVAVETRTDLHWNLSQSLYNTEIYKLGKVLRSMGRSRCEGTNKIVIDRLRH